MDSHTQLQRVAQTVAKKESPTPSQATAEKKFSQTFMQRLSAALPHAHLHLVGSTARDTGLQGDKDIDVFAAFDRALDEAHIIQKTVDACKKTFPIKWEMHYAEHPYLQGQIDGYWIEVIPCYKTEKGQKIKSAVDRTPLHMDYLKKQLSKSQRQDVRALKRLLKTHGIYGAELRVRGFSGLLCEYLILNYRSFAGLVDAARQWKPPVHIDMMSAAGHASSAAFDTPLVLIDAVDETRNVAAVVSATQVHRFISLCQTVWKQPDEKIFFPKKQRPANAAQLEKILKTRGTHGFIIRMKKPDVVEDILWPQLERTAHSLEKQLTMRDFHVLNNHAFDDGQNAYVFLELQNARLPPIRKMQGPSITHDVHVRQFIAGKKPLRGPWIENERVWVEEKRPVTDALALIQQMQKEPERYGIGSHWIKPFKSAKIIDQPKQLDKTALDPLFRFLHGKESWL